MQAELDELCVQIFGYAGCEFNINSPKQLADVLFDEAEPAADEEDRQDARRLDRAGRARGARARRTSCRGSCSSGASIQKLKGTYVDALPALVNPATGPRAHDVQPGGRRDRPAEQQRSEPAEHPDPHAARPRDPRARSSPSPGHVLISADYSQIELRVLAHLSGDAALTEAFTQGIDIHDRTAERVFGANSGLDPHELRRRAKIINYALLYGKTAFTLAKDIGVSQQAAQEFIDAYFAGFPVACAPSSTRRSTTRARPASCGR